jgi:hypothetical protein
MRKQISKNVVDQSYRTRQFCEWAPQMKFSGGKLLSRPSSAERRYMLPHSLALVLMDRIQMVCQVSSSRILFRIMKVGVKRSLKIDFNGLRNLPILAHVAFGSSNWPGFWTLTLSFPINQTVNNAKMYSC